jgi:hypothetical protein
VDTGIEDIDHAFEVRRREEYQIQSTGEEFHQFGHQDPSIEVPEWGRRAPATIANCSMAIAIRPAYGLSSLKQNQLPNPPCQTFIVQEKFRDSSSQRSDVAMRSLD